VVVDDPDNAAVELVEEDVNGTVAPSASAEDLADAVERVIAGGAALRESTADWFGREAPERSLERSLEIVAANYASARS